MDADISSLLSCRVAKNGRAGQAAFMAGLVVQSSDSHAESVELFVCLFVDGLHELFGVRSDRYADRRRLLLGNLDDAAAAVAASSPLLCMLLNVALNAAKASP